jgi:predicted DCC family thiol-disulfide oxidoreductase YuxK
VRGRDQAFTTNAPYSYKSDPAVPAFPDDRPIIIFDGHCVLCSRFARFVLRHDRRGVFRLTAAQTPLGQSLFRHIGLDPVNFETNVLLEDGQAYFKSDGTIRMFVHLGFPWSIAFIASVSMYSGRCTVMQGGNPIARAVTSLVAAGDSDAALVRAEDNGH